MRYPSPILATAFVATLGMLGACAPNEPTIRVLSGRLVAGDPIYSDAYSAFLLGALAEEEGEMQAASDSYQVALRFDPRSAETMARIALMECHFGRLDVGKAYADRAEQLDPDNSTVDEARAACSGAPVPDLERAVRKEPRDKELLTQLSAQLLRIGQEAEAYRRLEAWVLTSTTDPSIRMAAAGVAYRVGKYYRAAELAARAAELSTFYAVPAAKLAVELAKSGHLAEARMLAGRVVDLAPTSPNGFARTSRTLRGQPLVFRLAIDEALLANDAAKAEDRATKSGVLPSEVFGRALLLGVKPAAREVLPALVATSSAATRIARAALGDAPLVGRLEDEEVPPALVLAFADHAAPALDEAGRRALGATLALLTIDASDIVLVSARARLAPDAAQKAASTTAIP